LKDLLGTARSRASMFKQNLRWSVFKNKWETDKREIIKTGFFIILTLLFAPMIVGFFNVSIDSVISGDIYEYDKIKDVEIWLAPESARYAKEHKRRKGEKLTFNKDGSAVLYLPETATFEVIRWVMSECGNARVLKPKKLIEQILNNSTGIYKAHKTE